MERDPEKARLADLDRRLAQAGRPAGARPQPIKEKSSAAGAGMGVRIVTELLAGVLGGLLLGWFIDRLAGTSPLALIACLVLGVAAAFLNVWKIAKRPPAGPKEG